MPDGGKTEKAVRAREKRGWRKRGMAAGDVAWGVRQEDAHFLPALSSGVPSFLAVAPGLSSCSAVLKCARESLKNSFPVPMLRFARHLEGETEGV